MKKTLLVLFMIIMPVMMIADNTQNAVISSEDKTEFVKHLMTREKIVKIALKYQGIDYWYGSEDPEYGLDCSAFTQQVYVRAGIKIPRTAMAQFKASVKLIRPNLQKGDLVFFNTRGIQVNHVGIYIGDDKFIHAPRVGDVIKIESMDSKYYKMRFQSGGTFLY